jgi:hypothetical protein
MSIKLKPLLKDKNVLRIVVFIAIVNLLGYVMVKDFNAVVFFVITGLLSTYYSKNMIVVALIAMVATNIMVVMKRKTSEGFGHRLASDEDIVAAVGVAADAAYRAKDNNHNPNTIKRIVARRIAKLDRKIPKNVILAIMNSVSNNDEGTSLTIIAAKAAVAADNANDKREDRQEARSKELHKESRQGERQEERQAALKDALAKARQEYNSSIKDNFANRIDETNLEKSENAGSLTDIDDETDNLFRRQNELVSQYEKLRPALEESHKLLDAMGGSTGVQGMIGRVSDMIEKVGGKSANN